MQEPSPGKLLLVEDNPDDEALMLRAIKKSNIKEEVVVARDGAEALHYLLEQGPDGEQRAEWLPRVVFLDLKLPRLDGLEVLQRIRSKSSHSPVAGGDPDHVRTRGRLAQKLCARSQQLCPKADQL